MNIQVSKSFSVLEIEKESISLATWRYLNNFFATYRDNVFKEHIINISDAIDDIDLEVPIFLPNDNKDIIQDVTELNELCKKHNSTHVRFIDRVKIK